MVSFHFLTKPIFLLFLKFSTKRFNLKSSTTLPCRILKNPSFCMILGAHFVMASGPLFEFGPLFGRMSINPGMYLITKWHYLELWQMEPFFWGGFLWWTLFTMFQGSKSCVMANGTGANHSLFLAHPTLTICS